MAVKKRKKIIKVILKTMVKIIRVKNSNDMENQENWRNISIYTENIRKYNKSKEIMKKKVRNVVRIGK